MLNRFIILAAATVLGAILYCGPLFAQTGAPGTKPDFTAQLIVGGADKTDPALVWLGLHVRLGPGWHTYWRSAGDAGAPPEFDWSGSQNVASATVKWPAPHRFTDAGIATFGYADEVLFPVKLHLRDPHAPTHASLTLALFVCGTICTRNDLYFDAEIAPGARFNDRLDLIGRWRAKVPRDYSPDLSITSLSLDTASPAHLRIEANAKAQLVAPDVFVDGDNAIMAGRPKITLSRNGFSVIMLPVEGVDATHPAKPLHITLVDGDRSVEAVLQPQRPSGVSEGQSPIDPKQASQKPATAWSMIAVALLGGLILNFMPCVFPVLSLKLFSLLGHPSRDASAIRARFVASAVGVIASFVLLAVVLSALKGVGAQIGWGIQFQQPLFLFGMAAILVALGANLLDLYEIRLPWRLAGLFGQSSGGESIASHFFNGFVMTLLTTPCSAPFVGTAVGFALSQGTWQIFEIFVALGLGMASPYLVLAAVPQVGRFFPRPGRWMQVVRRVAAVAMMGTAVWLLTILAEISGVQTALFAGTSFGLLVWAIAVHRRRFAHAIAGTIIAGLAGIAIVIARERPTPASETAGRAVQWQPLVPQRIQAMVQSGRTVFVDIGAAWCVTCKVNEALIINSDPISQRLTSDVAPIQADWTKSDGIISAYLQSFGRYGLPFNVVFGPGAPGGIVLPELLTQEAVLNAFDVASSKTPSH
jgi:suppressor for copper-sensitivity B